MAAVTEMHLLSKGLHVTNKVKLPYSVSCKHNAKIFHFQKLRAYYFFNVKAHTVGTPALPWQQQPVVCKMPKLCRLG